MAKLVSIYLYSFLLISMITGILLREGYTVSGVTPSLISSAGILLSITFYKIYIVTHLDKKYLFSIFLFCFLPIVYIFTAYSKSYFFQEFNYSLTLFLFFSLIFFLQNDTTYVEDEFDKISHFNCIIFLSSILFSYLSGVGYASYTYGSQSVGTKGFLYGGNSASVFSIAVFTYFLFHPKIKKLFKTSLVIISLCTLYLVKTISFFIIPFVFLLYFYKAKLPRKIGLSFMIIIVLGLITYSYNEHAEKFLHDYTYRLERNGYSKHEKILYNIYKSRTDGRRINDSVIQLKYQIEHPLNMLIGVGRSGQIEFWYPKKGYSYNFAGMDISDLFFRYGLIGIIFITVMVVIPLYRYIKIYGADYISLPALLIVSYGFLGGYVFDGITILVFLSLFLSMIYKKINYFSNRIPKVKYTF